VAQSRIYRHHFEAAAQPDAPKVGGSMDRLNLSHDASVVCWQERKLSVADYHPVRGGTTMRSWVPPLCSLLLSHGNFMNEAAGRLGWTGTIAVQATCQCTAGRDCPERPMN